MSDGQAARSNPHFHAAHLAESCENFGDDLLDTTGSGQLFELAIAQSRRIGR